MLNKVILMGRLTRDPELRYTQNNTPVTSFTVAVDRRFKRSGDQQQQQQQTADFIDVVAWRNTAEFVTKWFTKGRMIIVVGYLQTRSWQDKDGNNRKSTEVVAEEVQFGESKRAAEGDNRQGYGLPAYDMPDDDRPYDSFGDRSYSGALPASDFEDITDDDDELPF